MFSTKKFLAFSAITAAAALVTTSAAAMTTPPTEPTATEAPTTDAPTTDAPTTDAPTTDAPTTDAPTTDAPTTDAPATEAPTTEEPTTDAPTTDAPTTDAPTTDAPTTDAPTTDAPTTDAPTPETKHIPAVEGPSPIQAKEVRLYDSRLEGDDAETNKLETDKPGKLAAYETKVLTLPSGDYGKAVLNLTVVDAEADGYFTIWNGDGDRPGTSSVNYKQGQVIANQVQVDTTAGEGESLKISLYSHANAHFVIDLIGTYDADSDGFTPIEPTRMHDSREPDSAEAMERVTTINALPDGVSAEDVEAVVANVTIVGKGDPGFATAWPEGDRPLASSLNYLGDSLISNQVITKVADDGTFKVYTHSDAEVIVDVVGYIKKNQGIMLHQPVRLLDEREDEADGCCHAIREDVIRLQVEDREESPKWNKGQVIVNVTVVDSTSPGYVSARQLTIPGIDEDHIAANTSTQNYKAGTIRAGMAIVPVSEFGTIEIYRMGDAKVIVDLVGYVASSMAAPARLTTSDLEMHKYVKTTAKVGRNGTLSVTLPAGLELDKIEGLKDVEPNHTLIAPPDGPQRVEIDASNFDFQEELKIHATMAEGSESPRDPKPKSFAFHLRTAQDTNSETDDSVDLAEGHYDFEVDFYSQLRPGSKQTLSGPYPYKDGAEVAIATSSEYEAFTGEDFQFKMGDDGKSLEMTVPSRKKHREAFSVGAGALEDLTLFTKNVYNDTVTLQLAPTNKQAEEPAE